MTKVKGEDRTYTIYPPEGETHCCICSEGQGGENQCPGRQAEKAEQLAEEAETADRKQL